MLHLPICVYYTTDNKTARKAFRCGITHNVKETTAFHPKGWNVSMYYRDYVNTPRPSGYRSIHITLYDNQARCYTEMQLRTKDMDDYTEIDEAYERLIKLQDLDLSAIRVNMFKAYNNHLINDGCGLFRGRQILPFEHLSRFQYDEL